MNLITPKCWINKSTQGSGPMNTVSMIAHKIRTARNPADCKKFMFDLAHRTEAPSLAMADCILRLEKRLSDIEKCLKIVADTFEE